MNNTSARYRQRKRFEENPALVSTKAEDQWFDRKSVRIEPSALANLLIAFANADGGTVVIGVENDGTISGVDNHIEKVNRLRQAGLDHTSPPVRHTADLVPCTSSNGVGDHVLVVEVHPSDQLHRNHRGEVYKLFGDQTRRLEDEEARELAFDKGERPFDGMPVPTATLSDLDHTTLQGFAETVGVGDDVERALRVRSLTVLRDDRPLLTWGALLLFGTVPRSFVPGAFIRILRYEGLRPQPGTRSNLIFDRRIESTIPAQIERAQQIMLNQLREVTRLNEQTGKFVTIPEIPRFAWLEAIVNAVTHRSYSAQGDYIRVSLFDDRIEVESPGRLPGPVRIDNIRRTRFSRNPRISRALADLRIVQELNEGMNRMFDEMIQAGLPEPVLLQTDAGFKVTLFNSSESEREQVEQIIAAIPPTFAPALDRLFADGRITTGDAARLAGVSLPTVRRYFHALEERGLLERVGRSARDPQAYWQPPQTLRGRWRVHVPSPEAETASSTVETRGTESEARDKPALSVPPDFAPALEQLFIAGRITTGEAADLTGLSLPTARRRLRQLENLGVLSRIARSPKDPHAFWQLQNRQREQ